MSELEQGTVIQFLSKEGRLAKRFHERLQAVYSDAAYVLPSVYFWVKEVKCGREDIVDQPRPGRPPIDNLDADILCVVRHPPFATVRSISEEVGVLHETVYRRLTESLQLRTRFLKGGLHSRTRDLKRKRVEVVKERLDILRFEERALFHRIITWDESWFYWIIQMITPGHA
jgi:hypothetical protein